MGGKLCPYFTSDQGGPSEIRALRTVVRRFVLVPGYTTFQQCEIRTRMSTSTDNQFLRREKKLNGTSRACQDETRVANHSAESGLVKDLWITEPKTVSTVEILNKRYRMPSLHAL